MFLIKIYDFYSIYYIIDTPGCCFSIGTKVDRVTTALILLDLPTKTKFNKIKME